ncbi:hypothetical protein [Pseudomonas sp. VI4.1]|uniref:hypothetical protein n=1 Tax=Pseudomonas sp. VI4.1 TaxID=1941346 RepID=UPI0010083311|nr:hypothetical protein [Pseudomonas sp. VI4.1]
MGINHRGQKIQAPQRSGIKIAARQRCMNDQEEKRGRIYFSALFANKSAPFLIIPPCLFRFFENKSAILLLISAGVFSGRGVAKMIYLFGHRIAG